MKTSPKVIKIRIVIGRNVYNVEPGEPIPGVDHESLQQAIRQYLDVEPRDSRQSRTYKGIRPDNTGVRLHIRGSDDEPHGQVCNGMP